MTEADEHCEHCGEYPHDDGSLCPERDNPKRCHCVECHDFVEPVGKTAHAELCTRDEDAATVAMLVNELDVAIFVATQAQVG